MSEPVTLNEEYVYRIAPDGKSVQAAQGLVKKNAFTRPKMSAEGTELEAKCTGSEPKPYSVRVDLSNPNRPQTSCDCSSYKRPCKHALGLILLAAQSPELFAGGSGQRAKKTSEPWSETSARKQRTAKVRKPADVGEALLQAVVADPEDDTPRLIYADWLEEQGSPDDLARAEFIRVQMELVATDDPKRARELRTREKALWAANREKWLCTVPAQVVHREIRFHRGFLDELTKPRKSWSSQGAKLFGRNPIYRIRLPGRVDKHVVGDLVVVPYLTRIRVLTLADCNLEEPIKTLQILFGCPFLTGLRQLILRKCGLSTREIGVLVASPLLGRVPMLDLADNQIGPGGIEMLAGSGQVATIRELSLANNPISDTGGKALASSPHLESIERLDLSGIPLGARLKAGLEERFAARVVLD